MDISRLLIMVYVRKRWDSEIQQILSAVLLNLWLQRCFSDEAKLMKILLEQRYGRAVDWWAFGVLLYQMLLATSPFRGEDEDEIFDAILSDEPLYPIHMPRESVSILQKVSLPLTWANAVTHPRARKTTWIRRRRRP